MRLGQSHEHFGLSPPTHPFPFLSRSRTKYPHHQTCRPSFRMSGGLCRDIISHSQQLGSSEVTTVASRPVKGNEGLMEWSHPVCGPRVVLDWMQDLSPPHPCAGSTSPDSRINVWRGGKKEGHGPTVWAHHDPHYQHPSSSSTPCQRESENRVSRYAAIFSKTCWSEKPVLLCLA